MCAIVEVEDHIGSSPVLKLHVLTQDFFRRDIRSDMAERKDFCKTNQPPVPAELRALESAF